MELSNINMQANTPVEKGTSLNQTSSKDNESNFSKVYKDVTNKANNDTSKTKLDYPTESDNIEGDKTSTSNTNTTLEKTVLDNTAKNDVDLNKLVELLLMSGNANQSLISLLKSKDIVDTKEIKDVISKIIKDNLSSDLSSKGTSETPKLPISGGSSFNELSKMLSNSNISLDEVIDNLASNIAEKLATKDISKVTTNFLENLTSDNVTKGNLLQMLLEKVKEPTSIAANDNSLKELIIKQLKSITESNLSSSSNKEVKTLLVKDFSSTTDSTSQIKAFSFNSNNDVKNVNQNNTNSETKFESILSSKDDDILKQLMDNDSTKGSKDSISDKIANVLNRFETLKVDNQPLNAGKLSINKATFNEDIIKAVKFMDVNNIKELSVKVIPKDLGEVVIRLSMDNGIMKANITATNKETYNLLNSQLPAINSELSKQNMTIQNFSLSLYNGEDFLFNGDGRSSENSKQQSKNKIKLDSIEDIDLQNEIYSQDNSTVDLLA